MKLNRVQAALALTVILCCPLFSIAQESQQAEQQAALQAQAFKLLDEVVTEAQTLRLPENRIRVLLTAGDLWWEKDEKRARSAFAEAATALNGMMQGLSQATEQDYFRLLRTPAQMREELLRVVARRDPQLAYEMFQTTRPPEPPANVAARGRGTSEAELELSLLAKLALAEPALALKRAEELLEKGQFPNTLANMLAQLRTKDEKAAASLSDKLLAKLRTEILLSNAEAGSLALGLLRSGPLALESSGNPAAKTASSGQLLSETDYRKLLSNLIPAALRATPRTPPMPGPSNQSPGPPPNRTQPPDPVQENARRLLSGLSSLLPQIDKYAGGYGPAVRQKLTETGQANNPRPMLGEYSDLMRQGSLDEILRAAANAPPATQPMLYQMAAMKATSEGQPDRARQIAMQYIPEAQRNQVLQSIERQQMVNAAVVNTIEQARQSLIKLRSDEERVDVLTRLTRSAIQQKNLKLATQLADEARNLTSRRAENYEQLEAQLKVARVYGELDLARGFEMLEMGIERINELLPAAALLEGFEVRLFKDGELPLASGGRLGQMVSRIGQELAALATKDFVRAQAAADKFQRPEPRASARLAIVQGALGKSENAANTGPNRGFNPRGQ